MVAEMAQDGKQVINGSVEARCCQMTPEKSWLPQQQLE